MRNRYEEPTRPVRVEETFQIVLICPTCNHRHEVTIRHAGQEVYCCGRRLTGSHAEVTQ